MTTWRVVAEGSRKVRERWIGARLTKDVDEIARRDRLLDSRRADSRRRASRRPSPFAVFAARGVLLRTEIAQPRTRTIEGERATLPEPRADYRRGAEFKNRPKAQPATGWKRTGPAITRVFSMYRRSHVQLAPSVEAESREQLGNTHM